MYNCSFQRYRREPSQGGDQTPQNPDGDPGAEGGGSAKGTSHPGEAFPGRGADETLPAAGGPGLEQRSCRNHPYGDDPKWVGRYE